MEVQQSIVQPQDGPPIVADFDAATHHPQCRAGQRVAKRSIPNGLTLVALLLCATQAFAAEPRITSSSRSESSHDLTSAERRSMSLAATRILRHAFLARLAVAEKDGKKAAMEVDQGLKLVEIIETVQPKYTVTAEIKAGDLSYSADEVVTEPLVSIYDEVGEVELFGPVAAAKKEQQSSSEDVVLDVAIKHTSVFLNLAFAKAGLTQAKQALVDEELERANRALVGVQRSTIFEVDQYDLPLATARENLFVAKTRVANGDAAGAKRALDTASKGLEGYANSVGDERAKEVKALQSEISNFSKALATDGSGASLPADAEKKILSWWDRAVEWWEE